VFVMAILSCRAQWRSAARGGGQICRPFVLGFENWRACLKYKSMSILRIGRPTRCSCNALFLLHANAYEIIQSEFSRELKKTIYARLPPLARAARCGPHPPHSLATPVDVRVDPLFMNEQLCVQLPGYADKVSLPASAGCCCRALHGRAAISCRPGPQQQTCSNGFAAVGPCWDRQADRQTD